MESTKNLEDMAGVSQADRDCFLWHNKVRENPQVIIPDLEAMLKKFDGKKVKLSEGLNLVTQEGAPAVQEAIEFLKKQKPLCTQKWNTLMAQAAKAHTLDLGPKGLLEHDSTDGTKMADRLSKYGQWLKTCGENLGTCLTKGGDGKDVVIDLIVDDGVSSRGHRSNIFNPAFDTMGCFTGPHTQYNNMTTIDYSGGFIEKGAKAPASSSGSTSASKGSL